MRHGLFSASRVGFRWLAAIFFIGAGINHFVKPKFYREIVPPSFPARGALVSISGFFEIIGGAGLLVPRLRRPAGWGLLALLVAVFPANIYMAVAPERIPDIHVPKWALWLRLPLQFVIMAWVWWVALKPGRRPLTSRPRGKTVSHPPA